MLQSDFSWDSYMDVLYMSFGWAKSGQVYFLFLMGVASNIFLVLIFMCDLVLVLLCKYTFVFVCMCIVCYMEGHVENQIVLYSTLNMLHFWNTLLSLQFSINPYIIVNHVLTFRQTCAIIVVLMKVVIDSQVQGYNSIVVICTSLSLNHQ